MNIKEYIQGKRYGKKANKIEREAMIDPFLQDAIDGFDTVKGNHHAIIEQLEKRIEQKVQQKKRFHLDWKVLSIAASVTLILSIGGWLYFDSNMPKSTPLAMDAKKEIPQQESIAFEELKPPPPPIRSTLQFTPPVLADDSDMEESTNNIKMDIAASMSSEKEYQLCEIADKKACKDIKKELEMPVAEATVTVMNKQTESEAEKKIVSIETFEEKEFKAYFEKKHLKGICSEKEPFVKRRSYIDSTGTPKNIVIEKSNCNELQKEIIKLLEDSPKWTKTQQTVYLEFKNVD